MQLQSSLFSRGVLLGLHDFSIQSTVVFLIINFLTSYFCKRLSFFTCKFCQQALLVYPRLFMRSFRFSPPRGRRSSSSHARKNLCRRLPKCSAEEQLFRQLFWPQPHARGGRQMRKNAVSQWLECCHLLLMSFRMVSAYFLSSLSTQE